MRTNRAMRKAVRSHVIGSPNSNSKDEQLLYLDIVRNLYKNPSSECLFYFNTPITDFGVPSKSLHIRDFQEEYIDFVMGQCNATHRVALDLLSLVGGEAIRTNKLLLDVAKVRDGQIVTAIELNRGQHYYVPDDESARKQFARARFCDMVKEKEMKKLCEFFAANYCTFGECGASSEETMRLNQLLFDFTHNI